MVACNYAGNENGPNFYFVGENPNYAEMAGRDCRPHNTVRGVAVPMQTRTVTLTRVRYWEGPHRFFMNRDGRFEDVLGGDGVPSRIRTVIAADLTMMGTRKSGIISGSRTDYSNAVAMAVGHRLTQDPPG